jgi:hypothetical protein
MTDHAQFGRNLHATGAIEFCARGVREHRGERRGRRRIRLLSA